MDKFFLIGIKGTGMASLALYLKARGSFVTGWDKDEVFYTDEYLASNSISFTNDDDYPLDGSLVVIYSSAYANQTCALLQRARRLCTCYSYPDYLSLLSKQGQTYAVAGTHGKTTAAASCHWIFNQGKRKAFDIGFIYGSYVRGCGQNPGKAENLLLEACEYRDHFLSYRIRGALVTSVDFDHPDYFNDLDSVMTSFKNFVQGLGFLVYCYDDDKARSLGKWAKKLGIMSIGYGFKASGPFHIIQDGFDGTLGLELCPYLKFRLPYRSKELIDDLIGSAILSAMILLDRPSPKLYLSEDSLVTEEVLSTVIASMLKDLEGFSGCIGRTEIMGEENGVVYIDDYAHHPSEIKVALTNIRLMYPSRKLVVAFKSHTASRTKAFLDDFSQSLSLADRLIISPVYSSARLDGSKSEDRKLAKDLCDLINKSHVFALNSKTESCTYVDDDLCASALANTLEEGSVCVTLGASNNRLLNKEVILLRRQR